MDNNLKLYWKALKKIKRCECVVGMWGVCVICVRSGVYMCVIVIGELGPGMSRKALPSAQTRPPPPPSPRPLPRPSPASPSQMGRHVWLAPVPPRLPTSPKKETYPRWSYRAWSRISLNGSSLLSLFPHVEMAQTSS